LEACTCQTKHDHDTDGCHRCILQARHNRDHANLSRQTAIRLLKGILENASKLEAVPLLSDIDIHPLIESELEKRFLAALRAEPGAQLQEKIVHGKAGYLWRIGDVAWEVALQVPVSASSTIDVPSRPDFIFYPIRPQSSRPIAVFLDGYDFHANEAAGRNRIDQDISQRYALIASGQYWVWSFSWEDIDHRHEPNKVPATRFDQADLGLRKIMASALLADSDVERAMDTAGANSWPLFLDYLQRPAAAYWLGYAFLSGVCLAGRLQPTQLAAAGPAISDLAHSGQPVPSWPALPQGSPLVDGLGAVFAAPNLAGAFALTTAGMKARNPSASFLLLHFDDDHALAEPDFAAHWRGLLALLNRVQFLPWLQVITTRLGRVGCGAVIGTNYSHFIAEGSPRSKGAPADRADAERQAEYELAHPAVRPLLLAIQVQNLTWPEIGYELMPEGRTIGTAELAWPDRRLAIFSDDQTEEIAPFLSAGWRTVSFPSDVWPESDRSEFILKFLSTNS
jgi:DEAD/DEAH box helicase domain-containing protein